MKYKYTVYDKDNNVILKTNNYNEACEKIKEANCNYLKYKIEDAEEEIQRKWIEVFSKK